MSRSPSSIIQSERTAVNNLANKAEGSENRILLAMGSMLHGIEVLTEQMQEVDKSINKFEDQVTRFSAASDKIEKVMIILVVIQIVLAMASLLIWFK